VLNNIERLQRALVFQGPAMEKLTPEDRESFDRFIEELDRLREEREIPGSCSDPDEIIAEAFETIPGAEQALNEYTRILDDLVGGKSE